MDPGDEQEADSESETALSARSMSSSLGGRNERVGNESNVEATLGLHGALPARNAHATHSTTRWALAAPETLSSTSHCSTALQQSAERLPTRHAVGHPEEATVCIVATSSGAYSPHIATPVLWQRC